MGNLENNALELAAEALRWTDEAIRKFVSKESLPEPLECKPGCHYCCYNLPMVTPPEALLIGHYVEQNFTNQEKKEVSVRASKVIERINGINPYEIAMMRHELPCIFLEEGMCMVYSVRPAVCRACTSTSAEHCKMTFETRNHRARLRCYEQIREIFHTVHLRLVNHCREIGCQSDALRLSEAIEDYFKHPNAIDAWLQGNIVFRILM
jgi:Fe-S-cluster containining protein